VTTPRILSKDFLYHSASHVLGVSRAGHASRHLIVKRAFRRGRARERLTEDELRRWIREWVAAALGTDAASVEEQASSFADLGLDSMQMTSLSGDLEEVMDRDLSPTIAWDYPSVERLTCYLTRGTQEPKAGEQFVEDSNFA
jgi:acyl carrier protein